MPPPLRKLFEEKIRREAKSLDRWVDKFPATIGRADGTILTGTSGIIWVQNVINGQEHEVHNTIAPTDRLGLHVVVGRYAEETLLRIKDVSTSYGLVASVGDVTRTAVQDQFIDRDHFLPFLTWPRDGEGFVVTIFGDTFIGADGTIGAIANQTLDLASHVPATGALYVVIEADDDGVIYATDGTPVDSKEVLTLADIPPITSDRRASCAVRLYDGQVQLYRDSASVNDFVDLRALTSGGGGGDLVYVRKFTGQMSAPTVDDDIDAGYLVTDLWEFDSGYGPDVYICRDNAAGAADWLLLDTGGGAVDSVNGQIGVVLLDPDDLDDTATTNKFVTAAEISKLAGIEALAEVNNISDADATELTDGSETTLHSHAYAPVANHALPGGRLTLTTGVPVTTADVTGATTVYYTPHLHNVLELCDGTIWVPITYTEVSLALGTVTSGIGYDVFGYLDSGALALESLAWTSGTARATAISLQDGRYCKTGDKTRLYLGSFYTTSTTQTEDSSDRRFLFNMYNRRRRLSSQTNGSSHNYNVNTVRPFNNDAANSNIEMFIGLVEDVVEVSVFGQLLRAATDGAPRIRMGVNTTTAESSIVGLAVSAITGRITSQGTLLLYPSLGYSYYVITEATTVGTAPGTAFESAIISAISWM